MNVNKKILGIAFAAALAAALPLSVLAAVFNNDPLDYPTLEALNYSENPTCDTCWSTSVSADAGEIVSFLIYYHNNSEETANGTRAKLSAPSSPFTFTSVSGSVWAVNAGTVVSGVAVNLSSSQTLTLIPGSVRWYVWDWYDPARNKVLMNLPFSQNGSEILGSAGLNLGDTPAHWGGYVVARMQVGGAGGGTAPTVVTNPATSVSQNSAVLNGSANPNGDSTTAWFEWGTTSSLGSSTTPQSVGGGNAAVNYSASLSGLLPNTTYYYRAAAQNSSGVSYGSVLNFITQTPPVGFAPIVNAFPASPISQNSATLNGSVNPNSAATNAWFEWGTTSSLGNSTSQQSMGSGQSAVNYSYSISGLSPNTTYYFRAAASNSYGTSYSTVLIFMTSGPPAGGAPTVYTNSASGVSQNSATLNGSANPNGNFTTAWFEYGTNSGYFPYTVGLQSIGSGSGSISYSAAVSGLNSNTTYYFRAAGQNSYGTSYGSVLSFTTSGGGGWGQSPTVYTNSASGVSQNSATLNGSANPNGSFTNAWFEYGQTQSLGYTTGYQSVGSGNYQTSVSAYLTGLSSNTTYYFRAAASNQYGTNYGVILSFSTGGFPTGGGAPLVITSPASLVFRNSALLNGSVNPNGALTTAWFEWGTSVSLGNTTLIQPMGGGTSYSNIAYALSGLSANTVYYFRTVAQNPYGTSYGLTLNFKTAETVSLPPSQPAPPAIITQKIIERVVITAEKKPLVTLIPAVDKEEAAAGEEINYTVVYRNADSKSIKDAVLKIVLPLEVEYLGSNVPPTSRTENVLSFNLGEVKGDGQGAIAVRGKIKTLTEGGTLIFFAILDYTDPAGVFQSVSAYLTVSVRAAAEAGMLASLIDFAGDWWWLLLILFLAVLAFLIYRYFLKRKGALPQTAAA